MSEGLNKAGRTAGVPRSLPYEETREHARTELAKGLLRATLTQKQILWCFRFKTPEEAEVALRLTQPIERYAHHTLASLGFASMTLVPVDRLKELVGIAFHGYRERGGSLHGLNIGYAEPSPPRRWAQGRGQKAEPDKKLDIGIENHGKHHVDNRTPQYLEAVEWLRQCTDRRTLKYIVLLGRNSPRSEMSTVMRTHIKAVNNDIAEVLRAMPSFIYAEVRSPEYRRQLAYFIQAALTEVGISDEILEDEEVTEQETGPLDPESELARTVSLILNMRTETALFKVLRLVGAGNRNTDIGDILFKDPNSVSAMVSVLFENLRVPKFIGGDKLQQIARRRAFLIEAWRTARKSLPSEAL